MSRFLISLVALLIMLVPSSCRKENAAPTDRQEIQVTIKSNEEFSNDLGGYSIEEGASISRQATNYEISTLIRGAVNTFNITYKYKPAPGYIGADEVELKSEKGSMETGRNRIVVITAIKFKVIN